MLNMGIGQQIYSQTQNQNVAFGSWKEKTVELFEKTTSLIPSARSSNSKSLIPSFRMMSKTRPIKLLENTLSNFSEKEIAHIKKHVDSIQTERRFVVTVAQNDFLPAEKELSVCSRFSNCHHIKSRLVDKKYVSGIELGLPLKYNPASFKKDLTAKVDELLKISHEASESFNKSWGAKVREEKIRKKEKWKKIIANIFSTGK